MNTLLSQERLIDNRVFPVSGKPRQLPYQYQLERRVLHPGYADHFTKGWPGGTSSAFSFIDELLDDRVPVSGSALS